jgi:hypothetical protein
MSRTIVLRISQRPRLNRLSLQAILEINGHHAQQANKIASVVNPTPEALGPEAMIKVIVAVQDEIRAWSPLLPLWDER